jgi:nucleotide-binding universal stress UspA family protein
MNILVAYDGSSYADAAIDDLLYAGLPEDTDVIVLSAVEWPLQTPRSWGMVETGFPGELEADIKLAERLASQGRDRLRRHFPKWNIQAVASPAGHASAAILDKAKDWPADLIVAGTHGRTGLARVVLGSVSLKLVREAACSVRIARPRKAGLSVRLLIGDDGSPEAEAAVNQVRRRTWPAITQVRIVAVHESLVPVETVYVAMDTALYGKINEDEHSRLKSVLERDAKALAMPGVQVLPVLDEGDPKDILVREAQNWNASAIFVGARGIGRVERILLGSVSSATVAHAPCTVEVVRGT